MNYSKATNYALHTMLILARNQRDGRNIGVVELATDQQISPTYLSKILTKLTKAGLVESTVGAQGGYCLAKPAGKISFLDIIQTIEGNMPLFKGCEVGAEDDEHHHGHACKIDGIMQEYEQNMLSFLGSKSLQDAI